MQMRGVSAYGLKGLRSGFLLLAASLMFGICGYASNFDAVSELEKLREDKKAQEPPKGELTEAERYDAEAERNRYFAFIRSPSGSCWRARSINVAGKVIVVEGVGYKWDFDDGGFDGFSFKGIPTAEEMESQMFDMSGATADLPKQSLDGDIMDVSGRDTEKTGLNVKDGVLAFTLGKNGVMFRDGAATGEEMRVSGSKCLMEIRARQSVSISTWTVKLGKSLGSFDDDEPEEEAVSVSDYESVNEPMTTNTWTRNFSVQGSKWQTIRMEIPRGRYTFFSISPGDAGNVIEIDYIKLFPVGVVKHFRKAFDVDSDVREAVIYARNETGFTIYVNGKEAGQYSERHIGQRLTKTDIGPLLRKGRNVIAVRAGTRPGDTILDGYARNFFAEGYVLTGKGDFEWIYTDASWKGAYIAENGWEEPGFDDDKWKNVAVRKQSIQSKWLTQYLQGEFTHPPYMGPIRLDCPGRRDPFFGHDEQQVFEAHISRKSGKELRYTVDRVLSEFTQEQILAGVAERTGETECDDNYRIALSVGEQGVYELHLELLDGDGNVTDTRKHEEFVVVGPTNQRETDGKSFFDGMDVELVDEIDCCDEAVKFRVYCGYDKADRNAESATEIVRKEFGAYRQTKSANAWSGLSYKLNVRNLGVPHVVEVEYPDDERRAQVFNVCEYPVKAERVRHYEHRRASLPLFSGGNAYPASGGMIKERVIYWPRQYTAEATIYGVQTKCRVAVSAIRIYEIQNSLPALRVPNPVPERMIGGLTERANITIPNFYDGLLGKAFPESCYNSRRRLYFDWYRHMQNLVMYTRFCGQNLHVPGTYMYQKVFFPSDRYGNSKSVEKDFLGMMAKMFEYNGISMLMGVQFGLTREFQSGISFSDEDVKKGAQTLRLVSRAGKQSWVGNSQGGVNWLLPEAQKVAVGLGVEIAEYYKGYPAVKGIMLQIGPGAHYPVLALCSKGAVYASGLDVGYGDASIDLFEKDTGIKVPVPKDAPDRFEKRYQWLKENARDKWIDWRCQKMHGHIVEFADAVRAVRSDFKIYMAYLILPPGDAKEYNSGKISLREAYRRSGIDPFLLLDRDDIVLFQGSLQAAGGHANKPKPLADDAKIVEMFKASAGKETGMYFNRRVAPHGWGMIPAGDFTAMEYAETLCLDTPEVIVYGKADTMYMFGGEQKLRRFAREYRSIPEGEYVDGDGSNGSMRVRELRRANDCVFYTVNMSRNSGDIKIIVETEVSSAKLRDLVSGTNVATAKDNTIECGVPLEPFGVNVFCVTDPDAKITVASE